MKGQSSLPLRIVATISSFLAALTVAPVAYGEFALNFQPAENEGYIIAPNTVYLDCLDPTTGPRCIRGGSIKDPDQTPFLQELMEAPDGQFYYHVIIGDQGDGFIQEFYIRAHGGGGWYSGAMWNASGGAIYNGGTDTFRGKYAVDPLSPTYNDNWEVMSTSGGSGSGNPERLIFRQLIEDPEMTQEVIKTSFLGKPRITQTVNDAEMSSTFEVDMSTLNYNDLVTDATVVNKMTIQAPGIPYTFDATIEFDMAVNSQDSNSNAGAYTYLYGGAYDGAFGDYEYAESSWDFYGLDWSTYSSDTNVPNN